MTNTLPDFSGKPDLRPLAELVRALREAGGIGETDCLLIGAAARDLWLKHGYGIEPGRETRDVDFAVAVADWEAFSSLRRRLIGSGEFVAWPGAALHRLRHRSWTKSAKGRSSELRTINPSRFAQFESIRPCLASCRTTRMP